MINVKSYSSEAAPHMADLGRHDIGFFGNAVDDRGRGAVSLARARTTSSHLMTYSGNDHFLDLAQCNQQRLRNCLRGAAKILIECTTLGVAEIIFLFLAAKREQIKNISLLYAEPGEYARNEEQSITSATKFNLTGTRQFRGVHGVSLDLALHGTGQAIFLLGYEEDRLAMLLTQQENLVRFKKYAIFGVPAFEPGWELNSFANHASRLASENFEISYAAANSVTHCLNVLERLHAASGSTDSPTIIAPIGTKPHGIAAALFLCFICGNQEGALIYDHPEKPQGRSRLLRKWHIFSVTVS